jgi:hypothetical protein
MPIFSGLTCGCLLDRSDRVEHVNGVAGAAIGAAGFAFRAVVAAIVDPEDHVAGAGDAVHVGDVALGGAVDVRRDVAVVEDDGREAALRHFAIRDGQQAVDPQPFGLVPGIIAAIIETAIQLCLDHDVAAGVIPCPHGLDAHRVGDGRGGGDLGPGGRQARDRRLRRLGRDATRGVLLSFTLLPGACQQLRPAPYCVLPT